MRLGSWLAVGEGTWTGGALPGASLTVTVGGDAGPSAAGRRLLLSVEIRSTMLDRQSRLETTELRSLFKPPAGHKQTKISVITFVENKMHGGICST